MIRYAIFGSAALALVGTATPLEAQDDLVRRLAAVATIAVDEYALGVSDGAVVNPDEYGEAQLFLANAAAEITGVRDEATRNIAAAYIDSLTMAVARIADPATVRPILSRFREELQGASGVVLDQYPDRAPSLSAGAGLYRSNCVSCHGPVGAGDGIAAVGMSPAPADLTDRAALSGTSPLDFFRLIGVGVAGTAMSGFSEVFSIQERWDVALYAASLRYRDDWSAGRELLSGCEDCLVLLSGIENTGHLSDDSLAALVSSYPNSSATPGTLGYARFAATAEGLGNDRRMLLARVVDRVGAGIHAAADAAAAGDPEGALATVFGAYLEFERVETLVRASSAGTAAGIEAGFADLRTALVGGDSAAVRLEVGSLLASLDRAVEVTSGNDRAATLFGKSLLIILREGLEAILIVGALAAFLVKAGAPERKKEIGWGVLAALGASLATAVLFATVWRNSLASQEMIEGVTMLVAAAVLFWVSYWLVSKIEMRRWQAFVRNQVTRALTRGSRLALPAVAFLAVYREGFETVLFYAALYSSADGAGSGYAGVTLGLVAGGAMLTVIYLAIERYGVRIPLKPFFAVTSVLLYIMAFSFVGQGITELQASGAVAITPVSWIPTVPALGIFPTVQTVAFQSLLAFAVVVAVTWIFWLSPRQEGATAG